ncbi:NAD(P)-dependent oxidoreductase [Plantactinospora sp. GCM10030261]|uniref:NAD(P)-dependent oxidoreductase n=1 Tax=Plantactinospora sp. GCM10030261 TaxID=3273420 RepID=UPI003605D0AB
MTSNATTPAQPDMISGAVSVLGLGRMGTALATALLDAGHQTTVWNRTAAKGSALAARGAVPAGTVGDAVQSAPLIITCLLSYDNVRAVLEPNSDALAGRTLVNLTTGTPDDAAAVADWATAAGIDYLDGAMMAVPQTVGTPGAFFLYSGSESAFQTHRRTLDRLATSHYVGRDPAAAELWDMALLSTGYAALTGFLHGVALLRTLDVPPTRFLPLAVQWLDGMAHFMPELADEIEKSDYSTPVSPVDMNRAAVDNLIRISTERGVDARVHGPLLDLLERRIADGHPTDSFASIVEVLASVVSHPERRP